MNDVARTVVAEDGVVLILAVHGEAARAALLVADELFVAVVPAAGALIDVAADRRLVPDLRRADLDGRRRHRRVEPGDLRLLGEIDDLHRAAHPQTAGADRNGT